MQDAEGVHAVECGICKRQVFGVRHVNLGSSTFEQEASPRMINAYGSEVDAEHRGAGRVEAVVFGSHAHPDLQSASPAPALSGEIFTQPRIELVPRSLDLAIKPECVAGMVGGEVSSRWFCVP